MIIERREKTARDDQETPTKSPIDSIDIARWHMGPASWNRDLLKGAGMEGAEVLDASLFVSSDFENTHVQPDECGILRETCGFL